MTTLSKRHLEFFRKLYLILRLISLPYTTTKVIETVKTLTSELSLLIIELLPETEHTIYLHLLGHIARGMELWGPPRSYWLFCFERLCRYYREHIRTHRYPESSAFLNISLEMFGWGLCSVEERKHLSRFASSAVDKKTLERFGSWYKQSRFTEKSARGFIVITGRPKKYILSNEEVMEIKALIQKSDLYPCENARNDVDSEMTDTESVQVSKECSKFVCM